MAQLVNNAVETFSGKTITLTADIALTDDWIPIGGNNSKTVFAGIFDGGSHTISGLSVANAEAVGEGSPTGIMGMTPEQLKKKNNFLNWDFNYIWDIVDGASYPFLRAFPPPDVWVSYSDIQVTYIFDQLHTKKQIKPDPKIRRASDGTLLTKGEDYTLSYGKNINAGNGTITVTGIGEYAGISENITFKIIPQKSSSGSGAASKKARR